MTLSNQRLTPEKVAIRLAKIATAFNSAHGLDQFPIEVPCLALGAASIFGWSDPIHEVQGVNIKGIEGALFCDKVKNRWLLLFNESLTSPGRIRFTQAHELGHYVLHRHLKESFECGETDMLDWSNAERNLEAQADVFASYLLMPLDDFRKQLDCASINLDVLACCAERYGVSLTASILKWLQFTSEKAVLVVSNEGFIKWSWSSDAAYKSGAFFRSRKETIPIPEGSLASNKLERHCRNGIEIPAKIWFQNAEKGTTLREMKIVSDQYDSILTLLLLPRYSSFHSQKYGSP